jgi:hypothetical protein
MYNYITIKKIQIQALTHGYQDCLDPDVFKTSYPILSKIWKMLRHPFDLDDLLILINRIFKDHLFTLEMILARLSTTGMRVNILLSPNLSSFQNK